MNFFNAHENESSQELVPAPEKWSIFQYEKIPRVSAIQTVRNIPSPYLAT